MNNNRTNELLKARAARLRLGTKESLPRLRAAEDRKTFRQWAELEFVEYARRRILEEHGQCFCRDVVDGSALLLGLSQVTTKRYLDANCAKNGPLVRRHGMLTLNADYCSPEQDAYWGPAPVDEVPSI